MSPKTTATVTDVLKTISDDKSLVLFNTIALSNGDVDICISTLELTRKQYYSRLSALLKAGLVKRERGKYSLTTFGIIVYNTQETIGKAADQYWKLKAIDSIRTSGKGVLRQEQFHTIIDKLITNQEIKNILFKQIKEKPHIHETEINQISPLNLYHKKNNGPKYEDASYYKARALIDLGNYQEAITYLDKALAIDPIPRIISRVLTRDAVKRIRICTNLFRRPFNPPGYLMEDLPADDMVAFNVRRRPTAEYFRSLGLGELCVDAWCNQDYALARMWGGELERSKTIAAGSEYCDFRWKKMQSA
jgi:tetratricopeptide (TPR) repeat protein